MNLCNGHEGAMRSWARLERALMNVDFSMKDKSAKLNYLHRKTSNHCPMLINLERPFIAYGLTPF